MAKICVEKGTKITCPKCKTVLAIAAHDLSSGERLIASMFSWIGKVYVDGEQCACYKCGAQWWDGYKIYTEHGWK